MRGAGRCADSGGMRTRVLGQRAPLLWLLLPWMAGLIVGKALSIHEGVKLGCLMAAMGLAALAVRRSAVGGWTWGWALAGSIGCAGVVAYDEARDRLAEWEALPPREVAVDVRLERRFSAGRDPRVLSGLGEVVGAPRHVQDLVGQRIHLSTRLGPDWRGARPEVSAVVRVEGRLTRLERSPPADTFAGY